MVAVSPGSEPTMVPAATPPSASATLTGVNAAAKYSMHGSMPGSPVAARRSISRVATLAGASRTACDQSCLTHEEPRTSHPAGHGKTSRWTPADDDGTIPQHSVGFLLLD